MFRKQGRVEKRFEIAMMIGTDKFGEPPSEVRHAFESMSDDDRLRQVTKRLMRANAGQNYSNSKFLAPELGPYSVFKYSITAIRSASVKWSPNVWPRFDRPDSLVS